MITGSGDEITQVLEDLLPTELVDVIECYRRLNFKHECQELVRNYEDTISSTYYWHGDDKYEAGLVPEMSQRCHENSIYLKLQLYQSHTSCSKEYQKKLKNPALTLVLFPYVQHGFFIYTSDLDWLKIIRLGNENKTRLHDESDGCRVLMFDVTIPPVLLFYILEFPRLIRKFDEKERPHNLEILLKRMVENTNPKSAVLW